MKLKWLSALLVLGALFSGIAVKAFSLHQSAASPEPDRSAIIAILSEQQAAWNRSDVPAFMKGYWNSPELSFAGSSGITRGWEPLLSRYRQRYPDAQAMGQLDFSELEVHFLGKDSAFVLGRWHLKRSSGDAGGIFTLIFQRFPEGWRIVHDHTSLDSPTPR
jgi:ketosteroid isomerase-like protein